ncbi:MAG: DUF4835 family protein [Bacteroidales bacterium]|nr:DUF4835 family protein [Bacteroidales bacterium]
MRNLLITLLFALLPLPASLLPFTSSLFPTLRAQELDARVTINHQQVEGTNASVFETLEQDLSSFINDRQWTEMQFRNNERISCVFSITVKKYDDSEGLFNCTLNVSATRPVYNSTYTTTTYSNVDGAFDFTYKEFDKLEFRKDVIDNDLTALIAYYVYMIIGADMDSMSPKGGTPYLQTALDICNSAQGLGVSNKGWKPFDDGKNRHGIITDWLDGSMEPFRNMFYKYYREGLDLMVENSERARGNITEAFELLSQARESKTMSMLPQFWTEYKGDEIVSIYQGHATQKEKDFIPELLGKINPSKSNVWNTIKN